MTKYFENEIIGLSVITQTNYVEHRDSNRNGGYYLKN